MSDSKTQDRAEVAPFDYGGPAGPPFVGEWRKFSPDGVFYAPVPDLEPRELRPVDPWLEKWIEKVRNMGAFRPG